jgi:alpha-ketoglutarate-dependent taurine dioxygenase
MFGASGYPEVIEATALQAEPLGWASAHASTIEETLTHTGAILLKRTSIDSPEKLEAFVRLTSTEIPDFKEESSPRTSVKGRVLTSTDYPSALPIQFHNEYSYARRWPMKLYFCCFQAPQKSGETPIADTRGVLEKMRPETRSAFERHGVSYVRNYRQNVGVSWQRVFRTEDKRQVERICEAALIEWEWRADGVLRTRQHGEAILSHPKTRAPVWFNHAFFFNVHALEPAHVREVALSFPAEDPLSTNTFFGDGSPIGAETIDELRALYEMASTRSPWEKGDVLLIDNMISAHARAAFKGKREILVVMADACSREQVSPTGRAGSG